MLKAFDLYNLAIFLFMKVVISLMYVSNVISLIFNAGLSIDEFSRKKLDLTAEELSEEKALAYSCLS